MAWYTVIKRNPDIEKVTGTTNCGEAIITGKNAYEASYQVVHTVQIQNSVYSKISEKEIEREEEGRCCVWV